MSEQERSGAGRVSGARRVVITGIGAVTPIGIGKEALWAGVRRGESAVRPISRFDPGELGTRIAAEIRDFDPRDWLEGRTLRRTDRYAQFTLAATRLALEDSRLDLGREDRDEIGVYVGSALGGIAYGEEQHRSYVRSGLRAVQPLLALAVFGGASVSHVAIDLGITGPNVANANSCASGAIAIGEAFRLIKYGGAQAVLAGGVEAPLAPLTFGAFSIIKAMSVRNDDPATASRPFDRDRDGFVMAEGGAILVLEELGHALRRDAPIYGEVLGYGIGNDAHHMTAPRPDGRQAARTIGLALAEAGLPPEAIDYVNAHASSTPLNDGAETLAIKRALGERAATVPVSGTKGLHAHALGATGAIEAALCALILDRDFLPATANLLHPAEECGLHHVDAGGEARSVDHILSNSFGFGGINATLIFGRYRG